MAKGKKSNATKLPTKVQAVPVAYGQTKTQQKQPKVKYNSDGSCIVGHREFVGDIGSTSIEHVQDFQINPQRNGTFPWLSAIASRFEMYRFKKLRFQYRPSVGTTSDGWIALGMDFDFYDDIPTKNTMLVWKYSSKSAVWQSCDLDLTQDAKLSTMRYCNYSTERGDARLDMLGKLYVLAHTPITTTIGELYVDYEVEFRQPAYKLPATLFAKVLGKPNQNAAQILGGGATVTGNMNIEVVPSESSFVIKDAGDYLVSFETAGTGQTTHPSITYSAPAGSIGAKWEGSLLGYGVSTDQSAGWINTLLRVYQGPIAAHVRNSTGDAGSQQAAVRLATYAFSLL